MRIYLKFFSAYRDLLGVGEISMELAKGSSLRDLMALLISKYPRLRPLERKVLLAVNREFAVLDTKLKPDDEVALMPPVGGG